MYGGLPLSFTANQGQADKAVSFLAKGQGYGLYLTANEAVLALSKPAPRAGGSSMQEMAHQRMLWPFLNAAQRRRLAKMSAGLSETDTLRMELKGSNSRAQVSGADELPGTTNYFLGNDPTRWRTRVPTFAKVHYTGVYPGVDLIYYGNQRRLEYDFVVAPHANPRQVELHFSGAQQLRLDEKGDLLVFGGNGEVAFEKPVVYQDEKGQRVPVKGRYALLANHTVGFKVGKYDRSKALVIDPTLSYATYLGGSTDDAGTAIAVDAAGSIYVIGFTLDADFPITTGSFQTTNTVDNEIAFVSKLNAAGSALVYSTYLGGTASSTHVSGTDAYGVAVDTAGSAYICGETFSNDFPVTTGAFQTQNNGSAHSVQNAFISKLSPDGTALVYSTYLGGSGLEISTISTGFFDGDSPLRMAVDGAGSAYVVGTAYSTDFPTTTGAYQRTNKAAANLASNAFVAKLSPNGSSLAYSTYLGGSGISPTSLPNDFGEGAGEAGYGIAVDTAGEAYVTGYTFSSDFPASGYQQVNRGIANIAANAFVSKLSATGTGLVGSTYLGGTGRTIGNGNSDLDATDNGDDGIGVALDASGDAYVIGVTLSTDFPTTPGAYQATNKAAANIATNVFVSKLDPTLSTLMYSTYVGGSGVASPTAGDRGVGDFGTGIVIDTAGNAYITGATESHDFPVTSDAFQAGPRSAQTVDSGFFTEVNPTGTALQYSTYLGGSGAGSYGGTEYSFFQGDFFYDIALDAAGNTYLTGYAYSYDFPVTKNALQRVNIAGGEPGGNSFVAKFGATAGVTFLPTTTTLSSTTAGASITFTGLVKAVTGTGVPTGTVDFYVNSVKATTVTLDATGSATYTTNQLTDTLNDVIVAYSGDATYGASGSSLGQPPATPQLTPTTLTLTANPASSFVGQTVTLTATLAPFNGTGFTTDGETVAFLNGSAAIGTGTLAGGVATFSTSTLPAGVDTLTASYLGDANLAASVSQALSYNVSQTGTTATTLAVTAGGTPVTSVASGTAVTLTATVTANGAPVTPGLVTFCDATAAICDNSAVLGTAQLTTAGTATLKFVPGIGTHTYNAIFAGTNNEDTSTSAVQALTVTGTYATTTTITLMGTAGNYTLTGTVQTFAPLMPSGSVAFTDTTANVTLGTSALTSAGLVKGFAAATTLNVGASPLGVATGDFNGDGIPDVAVCNSSTVASGNTVSILLGVGNGAFNAQVQYPEGAAYCNYMTVADVNGDGKLDVLVSNGGLIGPPGHFAVLLGNGDGTFQTPLVSNSGGSGGSGIVAGDFNGDGIVDFVITNRWSNQLAVFLGNGDGTFNLAGTIAVGNNPVTNAATGDFNQDGKLDLVVANNGDNTISVLLGNGDGTFQAQPVIATGAGPAEIAVADFNNDGKLDLSVSDSGQAAVSILLGNGDGTFQAHKEYGAGAGPRGQVTSDLNGDGNVDLAVADLSGNAVSVLLGNGDGTFQAQQVSPVGGAPYLLAIADLNGDGVPDIVNTNSSASTASVLLGELTIGATLASVAVTGAPGNHNVVATYPGDANFTSSTSTPVVLVASTLSTPAITSLSPNSAYVGSEDTVVTISGSQFLDNAAVTVNGTSQAATFVSETQLTTTLTAAQLSAVGTLTLAVVNPDGGTSNAAAFAVLQLPLQLTPPDPAFGNQTVGTTSAPKVVTVTNTTATAITITTITLDLGLNPGDFAQTNNCPVTLAAGANCQIMITFTPGGVGPKSAGLLVADNSPVPNQSVSMTGTGTGGILQVNPGNLKTIAGNGTAGYTGDDGPATAAELYDPDGVNFDAQGNLYIADLVNNRIRKVDTAGNITTVAGNGTAGFSGDGGPATAAELNGPFGVVPDSAGNLYIQDTLNARIRKVDTTGTITTIAGNGTFGLTGDGGPATSAEVAEVQGARFDAAGNLYVAQCGPAAIRRIDTNGIITTVAGNGTDGFSGDGGPATSAQLNCASGVAIDAAGELFIADYLNNRVRKVNANGIITTIAGNGTPGFTGDGGSALSAEINLPNDVDVDAAGDVFIADSGNNRLRKIDTNGVITTVVGGLNNAGSAGVNAPSAMALDNTGNLYFSDSGNNAVREVFPAGALVFPTTGVGSAASPLTVSLSNIGNVNVTIASQASFGLSGNTADFSLVGGTCLAGATLAANGACTLEIGFTPTALGLRTLNVAVTDDAVFSPQSFQVSGTGTTGSQTITFTPIAAQNYGVSPFAVTATASSGLPVTIAVQSGPATIAQNVVTLTGTGTVTLVATQAGNADYAAAPPVTTSFAVNPANTTLAVTASSTSVVFPATISLTATLSTAVAGATGTVTFLDGTTSLGKVTLTAGFAALNNVALAIGTHSINAAYSGAANFAVSTSSAISVVVESPVPAVVLNTIAPTGATAGASNTKVTATGANFTSTSVVNFNATPLATTFVSATQLTAVVPAALLTTVETGSVTVTDSASGSTSQPTVFTVVPSGLAVTFSGPSTTSPGEQPPLTFQLQQPYPVDLAGTMTLTFTPDAGNPANPQVQFASGGTTLNFTLPANSTATPAVMVQAGTVSGTITVTLQLTASGVNVTPASVAPITIIVPKAAPIVSAVSMTASGNTLTVLTTGYSTTREIQSATFAFTPANGASLSQKTITVPAATPFATWYTTAASAQYGSSFTYSQQFTLSGPASAVGSVSVTLMNTVGISSGVTSQ
jgi:sugar lactone lactonase YvrE